MKDMTTPTKPVGEILYLNGDELDRLKLGIEEIVQILEDIFREKAEGRTLMPPKIFFHRDSARFYSSMVSCAPHLGFAGCKWQSGDPENPRRGLPYIQGLYILNEDTTGQMVAIMDAKWITGQRTAAASALVAKYQARPAARTLGILGCGLQGRKHLEALSTVLPGLERCLCYDIESDRQEAYIDEMKRRFALEVQGTADAEEVVRGSDVLITGGPIEEVRRPVIRPNWIPRGALVITIDYDSYITDEAIAAMDIVVTDDREQIEDARLREGKFTGVRRIDADNADMIRYGRGLRTHDAQRIMAFNLGIALEDLATAREALRRARELGLGVRLAG